METVPQVQQTKRQHAVPQHVMGVEFKLVGEMTLRQFGFVAGGVILGLLIFNAPLPGIFRFPLAAIPLFTGLGIAFVPIQDRSLDIWLVNFIRSIYSPTQWVWRKEEGPTTPSTAPAPLSGAQMVHLTPMSQTGRAQLKTHLKQVRTTAQTPKNILDTTEEERLQKLPLVPLEPTPPGGGQTHPPATLPAESAAAPVPPASQPPTSPPPPVPPKPPEAPVQGTRAEGGKKLDPQLERRVYALTQKLDLLYQKSRRAGREPSGEAQAGIAYYKKQLGELERENQDLQKEVQYQKELGAMTQELAKIQKEYQIRIDRLQEQLAEREKQLATPPPPPASASPAPPIPPKPSEAPVQGTRAEGGQPTAPAVVPAAVPPTASTAIPALPTPVMPPFTPQIPNIVSGIITNQAGKLVEGAVVLIKDQDGDPVRALKTNPLGQFAITTAVPDGVYEINIKAPDLAFDIIKTEAKGEVMPPIFFRAK